MPSHPLASIHDTRRAPPISQVVPFRRARNGAVVPGEAVEVMNGDIAWRRARAAAREGDNVGAVALIVSDPAPTGETADDVLLTSFGEVNLDALRH